MKPLALLVAIAACPYALSHCGSATEAEKPAPKKVQVAPSEDASKEPTVEKKKPDDPLKAEKASAKAPEAAKEEALGKRLEPKTEAEKTDPEVRGDLMDLTSIMEESSDPNIKTIGSRIDPDNNLQAIDSFGGPAEIRGGFGVSGLEKAGRRGDLGSLFKRGPSGSRRDSGYARGFRVSRGRLLLSGSGLPRRVVKQYMRRRHPGLRQCYEQELRHDAKLGGSLRLTFEIQPTGKVRNAQSKGFHKAVDKCIQARVSRYRFPMPKSGGVKVTAVYRFTNRP